MTLREIRAQFFAGQKVSVTNHYITRPDHPCFGTNERTIAKVTTSHLWFDTGGNVPWPKATQISLVDGEVLLYGGGAGQQPHELFLSIRPIADA